MRTIYCPQTHEELARVSVGDEFGHVPGHQYHDVDAIVTHRAGRFRCQVVETWGSAQGYDEEHRRIEVVGRGNSVAECVRACGDRAAAAGVDAGYLAQSLSQVEDAAEEEKGDAEVKTAKANSKIFENAELDFSRVGLAPEDLVTIHLGINGAFRRQLIGAGDVECWCVGCDRAGRMPGMPNSPGFVCRLHFDDLLAIGFTGEEIYRRAFDCPVAEKIDADGRGVCEECLRAAGERGKTLPASRRREVCWSCAEMIDEGRRGCKTDYPLKKEV